MTQQEARERVARGAALLDAKRPGWASRIDVGTLTLHDACGCIVGQLLCRRQGTLFWPSVERFIGGKNPDASVYGFVTPTLHPDEQDAFNERLKVLGGNRAMSELYAPLQEAWIEAIADRLLPTSEEGKADPARFTTVEEGKAVGSA